MITTNLSWSMHSNTWRNIRKGGVDGEREIVCWAMWSEGRTGTSTRLHARE